jgi:glycosyltransferase involved in cell wall biosynthesis
MNIVITTVQVPFVQGGAEIHANSLKQALVNAGHRVEIVTIPFKWYPPERIHENILACRLLDLTEANGVKIDRVIGLKFPAYHVRHPNKVTWVIHQFRTAFEMWGTRHCDLSPYPNGRSIRDSIEKVERNLLPEARAIYANSGTVAQRLSDFCGIDSTPLYHPPMNAEVFHPGTCGDYLYFPSRINKWKRQELAIEAMALTREPVVLHISGAPDNQEYLEKLENLVRKLKLEKRVRFLGRIPFEEMIEQYANCRGVLFPPEQEDYGYITMEAMLSEKAVITCHDAGGPTEFIRNEKEGLVADPTPDSLALAMDALWKDKAFAVEAGKSARNRFDEMNISWANVVEQLTR